MSFRDKSAIVTIAALLIASLVYAVSLRNAAADGPLVADIAGVHHHFAAHLPGRSRALIQPNSGQVLAKLFATSSQQFGRLAITRGANPKVHSIANLPR